MQIGEEGVGSRSALLLWEVWQREKERTVEKQLGSSRSSFAKEKPVCLCRQRKERESLTPTSFQFMLNSDSVQMSSLSFSNLEQS